MTITNAPHPKKKPKQQWWMCMHCKTKNDPDFHPNKCRGCGRDR
ncbi:hypothetical protein [Thermoactinospora rubra]|nr:hypothetical protein [Thermoactinospora rubra]